MYPSMTFDLEGNKGNIMIITYGMHYAVNGSTQPNLHQVRHYYTQLTISLKQKTKKQKKKAFSIVTLWTAQGSCIADKRTLARLAVNNLTFLLI